jgi:hypothetical protein
MFEALKNLIRRSPRTGDGKDSAMPDETTTAASSGPIDYDKLATAMATANATIFATAVADTIKPFSDALAKQQPAAASQQQQSPAGDKPVPLTEARLLELLNKRDEQQQQSSRASQARSDFIAKNLANLPPTYHNLIPQTDDLAKLAEAGKTARSTFEADFKVSGNPAEKKTIDGGAGGGVAPGGTVDLTKVSPVAKIEMGLKASTPVGSEPKTETTAAK